MNVKFTRDKVVHDWINLASATYCKFQLWKKSQRCLLSLSSVHILTLKPPVLAEIFKDTDMKSAYSSDLIFVVLVTSKINKTLVLDVIPDVGIPGKLPYKPCST